MIMLDESDHEKRSRPIRVTYWGSLAAALVIFIGAVITIRPFLLLGVDLFITSGIFVAIALIERYGR